MVKENLIGQIVRCPKCKHRFEVTSFSSGGGDSAMSVISVSETSEVSALKTAGGTATSEILLSDGVALGRFRLQRVLGQGGFGKVYRAYDPQLDRVLAIKVPTFSNDDTKRVQRFLTEARAAARLRHPNIVPTFESGKIDGRYFIAAQFISGRPLNEVIKAGGYERRAALEWIVDLAGALSYAHENDVVHRDIKPHNVMIDENGQPQLMDFGLARRGDEESTQTTDGTLLGTPAYMPPEQARGALSEIGPWSDQYSLGVILYEVLTGQRPFQGEPHAVINKVLTEEPASTRSIDRTIPRDLDAICHKAMSKLAADRYPNCEAFAEDLRRWLKGESTKARPLSVTQQFWRWGRKNPVIGAAAMVCLAAVGSVAILAIAVAIDQRKRNDVAEAARDLADNRKNEADQANATLNANYKVLEETVRNRNEAVKVADDANQRAQTQAELANTERQTAKQLLLNNQLQQLDFEKRRLLIPEAMQTIDEALVTSHDLQKHELAQGLMCDKAFLRSVSTIQRHLPEHMNDQLGGHIPVNDQLTLSPQAEGRWRLYDTIRSAEFGDVFSLDFQVHEIAGPHVGSLAATSVPVLTERLIELAVLESRLTWITVGRDADIRFWGTLRRHDVSLETGVHTLRDGPEIMSVDIGTSLLPIWCGRHCRKIAFRSRTKSSEIVVADAATFEKTATIESPEDHFHAAVFNASEQALCLAEKLPNNRLSLVSYPADGIGSTAAVFRNVNSLTLEPVSDLAIGVYDQVTEIRSLKNGLLLGEFPGLTGRMAGRIRSDKAVAVLNNQQLLLAKKSGNQVFGLDRVGNVNNFELNDNGQAHCFTSDRQLLLDLNSRLFVGSMELIGDRVSGATVNLQQRDSITFNPHPHLRIPDGMWKFGGFIDADHALLVEPESHELQQINGNLLYRYEIERIKSLAVFPLAEKDSHATVTPVHGFAGRQKLIRVSAFDKSPAPRIDQATAVNAELLQRLSASEDSLTISHRGKFAAVRNVESVPSIALYDLKKQIPQGDQHLAIALLSDKQIGPQGQEETASLLRGQVRFNSTDELFVYRLNAETLGIVSTDTGERIGPPLKIPAGVQLHEVGWTADSTAVWAVTTKNAASQKIEIWDVVSGTHESRDVALSAQLSSCCGSPSGRSIMLRSSTGQLAVFDTIERRVRMLKDSEGISARFSGFSGQQEYAVQVTSNSDTGSPSISCWKSENERISVPSEKSTIVLPIQQGTSLFTGRINLSESTTHKIRRIQFWNLEMSAALDFDLSSSIGFQSLLVSLDGKYLLTVDLVRTAQLWHVASGHAIGPPLSDIVLWPPAKDEGLLRQDYHFAPNCCAIVATQDFQVVSMITIPASEGMVADINPK